MFYTEKPKIFDPKMHIVICYCMYFDEILFLRRKKGGFQGGLWTAPGGKKEANETSLDAIIREVFEETSIIINKDHLDPIGLFFIKYPNFDFDIEIFKTNLSNKPNIHLCSDEHDDYKWIIAQKALSLPLIPGAKDCLNITFFATNIF